MLGTCEMIDEINAKIKEMLKKRLTTFKDQRSRPGNLKEAREMVERMGIRFGVTGWALPGFKDDTIYEDEEDE